MPISHFWELLSANQPWNMMVYFGVPLLLTLIITATELCVLYRQESVGFWKTVNMICGYLGAIFFAWVFYRLLTEIWIPLSFTNHGKGWHGPLDFLALTCYLATFLCWLGMAASDLPWSSLRIRPKRRLMIHAGFLGIHISLLLIGLFLALIDSRTLGL